VSRRLRKGMTARGGSSSSHLAVHKGARGSSSFTAAQRKGKRFQSLKVTLPPQIRKPLDHPREVCARRGEERGRQSSEAVKSGFRKPKRSEAEWRRFLCVLQNVEQIRPEAPQEKTNASSKEEPLLGDHRRRSLHRA